MEDKFWYKLLKEKSKIGTGLTIPFLIGSQKILKFKNIITIKELLSQMIDSENEIFIKYCFHAQEYICTINKNLAIGYYKNVTKHNNLTIIADNSFLVGVNEYEYIIETFELFYSKNIKEEKYSRIVNNEIEKWNSFEEKEIIFINSSIKK